MSCDAQTEPILSVPDSSSHLYRQADFNARVGTGFVHTWGCGTWTGLLRKAEDPPPRQVAAEALDPAPPRGVRGIGHNRIGARGWPPMPKTTTPTKGR